MTRFWISLNQGVNFVLSTIEMMNGGEIFVPKIPSMKMVEMASLLAPDIPQRVIGIRPGEKLHETMISEDDSRNTIEFGDRYAILPAFDFWGGKITYFDKSIPVNDGFVYSSASNSEWLNHKSLSQLLDY